MPITTQDDLDLLSSTVRGKFTGTKLQKLEADLAARAALPIADQERYLTRVCRGEAIAAFALSEADAGSDVAALSTTARRSDDGRAWLLDGEKVTTTVHAAPAASETPQEPFLPG